MKPDRFGGPPRRRQAATAFLAALQAVQAPGEPGDQAAAEFPEAPMVRVALHLCFFRAASGGPGRRPGRRGAPVHRQRHDEDQPLQSIRRPELRVPQIEAPAFEVGEHRFDGPAGGVVQHCGPRRDAVHGDDPRLRVACLVQDAQVRHDAPGEQPHPRQVAFRHAPCQSAGGGFVTTARIRQQVAFQPQPVTPALAAEPGEQVGRRVEPVCRHR